MNRGNVSILQLISWGVALATTATGIFWARVTATDTRVDAVKVEQVEVVQRVARVEEAITTLKETANETRADVKSILGKLK